MQMHGIDVIPTISWSDKDSFEWCFDGEPVGSVVAVSSVGCMNSRKRKGLFMNGYRKMMERLKPTTVIFYGKILNECEGNIIPIKAYQEKYREME